MSAGGRGPETIAQNGPSIGAQSAPVLSLLFDPAARPDARAVRDLAERGGAFSIGHDPALVSDAEGGNWLELIANGLTFDLTGLAPGEASMLAPPLHRFDLPEQTFERHEAIALTPGPHLSEGAAMLPVVRSQMWLATLLCDLPGLAAVGWLPARSLSGVEHFRKSVRGWLEGGAFPGLGLTALLPVPDGGMQSEGLAFFTGQELRIEPELAGDKASAARLALRLVNVLVELGTVEQEERFTGPDGTPLALEPSANRRFVRVRRA